MIAPTTITQTVVIPSGESLSSGINLVSTKDRLGNNLDFNRSLFGIVMPSAWTAANITLQMSIDGGSSWHDVFDADGNEVVISASSGRCIIFWADALSSLSMIRLRSGSSSAPVVQTDDRVLELILRGA